MTDVAASLERLAELREIRGRLDAEETELLAELHAADRSGKEYLREEVAKTMSWSFDMTRARMHEAVELRDRFVATTAAVQLGIIGSAHARAMLELTIGVPDRLIPRIEDRVLPTAGSRTSTEFRAAVRRAVAHYDRRGEDERHEHARTERRISARPELAGMGSLYAWLSGEDVQAIWTRVQAVADTAPAADPRTADQRRADAFVALCLGAASGDLPKEDLQQGRRPAVNVTVGSSTLLGLDDRPGELDGYGPISADQARRIAADSSATWRRVLTDPAGRIVDYGRTTYRPPADLREFVIARDRTCRMPGCNRQARRCDIDHVVPYEAGDTTSEWNLHCLCPRHHALKHEAGWHIERLPDGTTRWTTPRGQVYEKPPDVIDEPDDRPDEFEEPEPPPF